MKDAIKLYYAKIGNMGDLLNPLIIGGLFGFDVERHSFLTGEMTAIGSGLDQYVFHGTALMRLRQFFNGLVRPSVCVWGTGFINYATEKERFFKRDMRFCAVRGELSRKRAEMLTGNTLNIPTGDGGLLASLLIKEPVQKKYDLGVVPHVCDLPDPKAARLLESYPGKSTVLINVKDEPLEVLRTIAQCNTVLSSSLHGLIVADSFGIPNRHVVFSDRPLGDGFKFDDYYSAYGVPHILTDLSVGSIPSLSEIAAEYPITGEAVRHKKRDMLATFPYPIPNAIII
jgi:pyruvyltransferase